MKTIMLDIKNLKTRPDDYGNPVGESGVLVCKTKEILKFEKIDKEYKIVFSEKSPYTMEDLISFSYQSAYCHHGDINLFLDYLVALKILKKVMSLNFKKGWKIFYFGTGLKGEEKEPIYFRFASKEENKASTRAFYEQKERERNFKGLKVKKLTSIEELDEMKSFTLDDASHEPKNDGQTIEKFFNLSKEE